MRTAEDASISGDAAKSTQYTTAAEAFANRMIALENEIEGLKALHLQATQAANQAKAAVEQNSAMLQKLLAALNECTEWGQVFLLDCLAQYQPSAKEAENIIERVPRPARGAVRKVLKG